MARFTDRFMTTVGTRPAFDSTQFGELGNVAGIVQLVPNQQPIKMAIAMENKQNQL
jgi:hypothetical protein